MGKPLILCLHGGGTSGEIFSMQCRSLIRALQPHFTLLFADAPFLCAAGPGVVPVYADCAPFRRWLRWKSEHASVGPESTVDEIMYKLEEVVVGGEGIRDLMEERGAKKDEEGEFVGLLGFSQGAKVVGSLLLEQQVRRDYEEGKLPEDISQEIKGRMAQDTNPLKKLPQFKFGVICNGRSPLASLSPLVQHQSMVPAGDLSEFWTADETPPPEQRVPEWLKLRTPTIHVHGLQDPGLHIHRWLQKEYCDPKSAKTVEWDGDHRMVLKSTDVDLVVNAMLDAARETGVDV